MALYKIHNAIKSGATTIAMINCRALLVFLNLI